MPPGGNPKLSSSRQILNLQKKDPFDFADDETEEEVLPPSQIHLRVQQRNGRKCVTTVQGLSSALDLERLKRAMCKTFSCGGTLCGVGKKKEKEEALEDDEEESPVIQLTGDQRQNVLNFLCQEKIASKEDIIVHGF